MAKLYDRKSALVAANFLNDRGLPFFEEHKGTHLQDLDGWLRQYNEERPHSGKYCYGKIPMQTFFDSIPIAREKMIGYETAA